MWSDPVNIVLAVLILSALIVGSLIVLDPKLWRGPRMAKKLDLPTLHEVKEKQEQLINLLRKYNIVIECTTPKTHWYQIRQHHWVHKYNYAGWPYSKCRNCHAKL